MKKLITFLFSLPFNLIGYILRIILFAFAVISFVLFVLSWLLLEFANLIADKEASSWTESPEEAAELAADLFTSRRFWRWNKYAIKK